jgi:hypothetical protein
MTPKQLPGTDITAIITVRDSQGDPMDLSSLPGFTLLVFIKPDRIIAQFSEPATSGYTEINDDSDLSSGTINITIPAEKTADLRNQMLHIVFYGKTSDETVFGTTNGLAYELVEITSTPSTLIP